MESFTSFSSETKDKVKNIILTDTDGEISSDAEEADSNEVLLPTTRTSVQSVASVRSHEVEDKGSKTLLVSDFLDTIVQLQSTAEVMIMNKEGKMKKSTIDNDDSGSLFCNIASQILKEVVPLIQAQNPKNRLRTIRSHSSKEELIIAPIAKRDLIFVIVQNCVDRDSIAANCVMKTAGGDDKDKLKLLQQKRSSLQHSQSSLSMVGSGSSDLKSSPSPLKPKMLTAPTPSPSRIRMTTSSSMSMSKNSSPKASSMSASAAAMKSSASLSVAAAAGSSSASSK